MATPPPLPKHTPQATVRPIGDGDYAVTAVFSNRLERVVVTGKLRLRVFAQYHKWHWLVTGVGPLVCGDAEVVQADIWGRKLLGGTALEQGQAHRAATQILESLGNCDIEDLANLAERARRGEITELFKNASDIYPPRED